MYPRLNRKTGWKKKLNSVTYSSGYSILDEKKKKHLTDSLNNNLLNIIFIVYIITFIYTDD